MKRLCAGTFGFALTFWLAGATAGELQWRPVAGPPTARPAPVTLATPVPVTLGRPVVAATAADVSLGRPNQPNPGITLTSYTAPSTLPRRAVVRAQDSDAMSSFAADGTTGDIHTFVAPVPSTSPPIQSTVAGPGCDCTCDSTCDCCDMVCCECASPSLSRWYISAEYLMWWIPNGRAPALLTTGPASLPPAQQGVIGAPGTVVLQDGTLDYQTLSGGRFALGYWFDPCQNCGLESRFFFLGQQRVRFAADGNAIPVLARPFFNENLGQEAAELASSPGIDLGRVNITSSSQLWSAEVNLRKNLHAGCWCRWNCFAGFRYLNLREDLTISETIRTLENIGTVSPLAPNSQVFVYDSFKTTNQFYGGQIGTDFEFRFGNWFTDIRTLVALGRVHEAIDISGSQSVTPPGGPTQHFTGGLLALPSNIGHVARDRFAVVPEVGLNFGYNFTENCRAYVGYSFLYWSKVVRPGNQVDRVIDVNQVPNAQGPFPPVSQVRPTVPFTETDFWAHGVNFGLECRW